MAINNSNMKQIDSCFLLPQDLPFPLLQLIRQSPLTRGSIAFLHVSIVPNSSFQGLVKLFKGIQDRAKLILANSVRPIRNAAKHWGDVTYCTSVFQVLTFYKIYDRKEKKKKKKKEKKTVGGNVLLTFVYMFSNMIRPKILPQPLSTMLAIRVLYLFLIVLLQCLGIIFHFNISIQLTMVL